VRRNDVANGSSYGTINSSSIQRITQQLNLAVSAGSFATKLHEHFGAKCQLFLCGHSIISYIKYSDVNVTINMGLAMPMRYYI
jgi:hypothetical protein